jgi:hypothetical protein
LYRLLWQVSRDRQNTRGGQHDTGVYEGGYVGVLVVGSVALDSVKTPFGAVENVLGGSASYFSTAASFFTDVSLVGVVGEDFPSEALALFRAREINVDGLERVPASTPTTSMRPSPLIRSSMSSSSFDPSYRQHTRTARTSSSPTSIRSCRSRSSTRSSARSSSPVTP